MPRGSRTGGRAQSPGNLQAWAPCFCEKSGLLTPPTLQLEKLETPGSCYYVPKYHAHVGLITHSCSGIYQGHSAWKKTPNGSHTLSPTSWKTHPREPLGT